MSKAYAIDLFAGGGGLAVGLKRAGFDVVGAVEIEKNAIATYKANHPEVTVIEKDIRDVRGKHLKKLSPTGSVDLLAGCPPCQGFSSLTAKYKRKDPRNELIREMGRLVKEIMPTAIMMENVPGLAQKGNALFEEFCENLEDLGYEYDHDVLQVANYGVPQSRRRLVLIAGKNLKIDIPPATHSRTKINGLSKWKTVAETIKNMPKPITLIEVKTDGEPKDFNWHVVRSLSPANVKRIQHARPGESWRRIPKRMRPECHKDKSAGFPNVYGRMSWDEVSPTITGGCTTFSKGRFGHPQEDRTISVREAALLQAFPSDYVFDTPYMEHVCNIVGNALPCDFAEAIARQVFVTLKSSKNGQNARCESHKF